VARFPAVSEELGIGVLGPLEVSHRGRPVDGGTVKERSLLGLLALRPGRIVSHSEIIDVLWGERPPATCQSLVHTYTSKLRKLIGAGRVSKQRGGYLLRPDGLDLQRFEELAAEAARSADPRLYAAALDCWRGPVLADLPAVRDHPAAIAVAGRRLTVALEYADLMHGLGLSCVSLVAQLRLVAREEPLHEGLHARLMLALADSGQQAAALRLFVELRGRLDDELGVRPGTELTAAHLLILRQRNTPASRLPADVAGFAGRSQDLDVLDGLAGTVVIAGMAGIGKTALAVHWAHRVRNRFPDGQLYVDLRGYAPGTPATPLEALTRLLRELGVPGEQVPVDEDEAATLLRTQLADRKVLLVLDNAASAEHVRPLLPGNSGCLAVITSRDRLGGLVAIEGARRLTLDVLSDHDAVALLAGLLGADRVLAERDAVAELCRMCAHLPLALRIAAANIGGRRIADHVTELRARGGLRADAIRAAFDLSYARLSPAAQRLFRLLGLVAGPDFTEEAAAALAGSPVRRELGQLAAAHLVHQPVSGRYQLHDLLREYAAQLADEPVVDRLLTYYLETAGAATRVLYPHALRLPNVADAPDGQTPGAAIGWLEAERPNLVAAAVHAARLGHPSYAWRIADALRGYFVSRGHAADGLAVCRAALAAAVAAGDAAGEASAQDVLGLIHYNLGDFEQAMRCHTRALALNRAVADLAAEASSLHNLGRACTHLGQPARAAALHEQALEINRRIGNRHGEAIALNYIGSAALQLGEAGRAREYTNQALRLSRELGDRHMEARSLNSLGLVHWAGHQSTETPAAERYAAADACFTSALGLTREIGFSYGEASVLIGLSRVRRSTGRPREAISHCRDALSLMRDRGIRLFEGRALAELAHAHLELGETASATTHAQHALTVARQRNQRLIEARALHVLGLTQQATGNLNSARAHWRTAEKIFTEVGAPEGRAVQALLGS
jgi:DNA-binding SARP family transcriptional activator/tetratricopeptide (TPR) repeat protein